MSVRRELLERELNALGFHKAAAHASGQGGGIVQQQQQGGASHPQADTGAGEHSR